VSTFGFKTFVYSPSQSISSELAISASRCGGVGVVDAIYEKNIKNIIPCLQKLDDPISGAKGGYAVHLGGYEGNVIEGIKPFLNSNLKYVIVSSFDAEKYITDINKINNKTQVIVEYTSFKIDKFIEENADGIIVKGNESGGFTGEESSFILLQKFINKTKLPLYIRGGLTPHVAAACAKIGMAGGVLDSQVLLLDDSPLQKNLQKIIAPLSGSETVAVGDGEGRNYFRILNRPQLKVAKNFIAKGEGLSGGALIELVSNYNVDYENPLNGILPVGHDICFAQSYRKQYGTLSKLLKAIDKAVLSYPETIKNKTPLAENSPLAKELGVKYPIVQGPMTRVSDTADFANSIAKGGALPMLAFALMSPEKIETLLRETKEKLGSKPWGVGLLGFVKPQMLKEQIQAALPFKPNYAIIAGGRPDQAVEMEKQGVPSFLHLPSANLLENFLKGGARRFIFEGRECGGHIGPLSSFTLWSTMIDRLQTVLDEQNIKGEEVQCLFAGGIHDELSSAMLQVMIAPLAKRGVKLGIIMGSAYLFTQEIVEGGGVVEQFQKTVIDCEHTVNLESGHGHASRCAYTPFAKAFFVKKKEYNESAELKADEIREKLDKLILGTLRVASKGKVRKGNAIEDVSIKEQKKVGMYMLGQVVPLRSSVTNVEKLHNQVIDGAAKLISQKVKNHTEQASVKDRPSDIAIVGIEVALPGAKNTKEFWQNILDKVDSIGEVPKNRWDYNLYFNEDRNAKDKVYSKWGGFMEDMVFDPMKYGITPKSIESVDPMQLMTLEVASAALNDAGFDKDDDELRKRTAVIIGASGGAGDVGMQYGVRSELPRFLGELPQDLDKELPQWSEDTFAGILINVVPGRIANRLNLGGVNYTTDAACASSLSAVYQAVNELQSGNCDVVVTGGSDTVQGAFGYMCFSQTQALSPTGRCRTFDESSDGIVISEGIVMIVLKRLEDAERDGDRIYSVIKGVGGGSDGKAKGLSAPLPEGQLQAMNRAYEKAGFSPNTVGLFEAHGTGTVAGDTAELESTSALVKSAGANPKSTVIGSVKTMIGHTKATAGVAGMAKAALALYYKTIPPHRGVNNPNKVFLENDTPFYLVDEARPWVTDGANPRRAAVSAFGFGGTNFHAVLEEYTSEYRGWMKQSVSDKWDSELFLFSGNSIDSLLNALNKAISIIDSKADIYLRDFAQSCAKSFASGGKVVSIVADNFENLKELLLNAVDHISNGAKLFKGIYYSDGKEKGKLAVLFSGQGSQYTGMLRELSYNFPSVCDALSDADRCLKGDFAKRFDNKNLSNFIFPHGAYSTDEKKNAEKQLTSTDIAQPALGAVEAGLWRLASEFGIEADMLAGHSYGEFVALYASGQITFEDLMKISEARGRLIVDKAKDAGQELGTMAAVRADREKVESIIKDVEGVVVANHNSPKQVIISGSVEGIESACEKLSASGCKSVVLPVSAAFHSKFVEPARASLEYVINDIKWNENSDIVVYSNNTAKPHVNAKESMADHLTGPVEFVTQIENMYEDGARVFLELGPKNVLSKLVGQILIGKPHSSIAIDDNGGGIKGMLYTFGQLIASGVELNIEKLFEGRDCLDVSLDKIASAGRTAVISKHSWLLNGSRARRFGEPVKQIGTTLEKFQMNKSEKQSQISGVYSNSSQKIIEKDGHITNRDSINKPLVKNQTKQRIKMRNRNNNESSVTQAYFDLVSQQLNNARDVALAELGVDIGDSGQASKPQIPARRPVSSRPSAVSSSKNVTSLPIRSSAPRSASVASIPAPAVARSASNASNAVAAQAPVASISTEIGMDKIKDIILSIVTEKTGYEADMIEFDQNLEADLGVDSIKRVDIVGGVLDKLPDSYKNALGDEGRTKLNTATTLDVMLEVLNSAAANNNTPSAAPTSTANLDSNSIREIMLNIVTEKTGYEADMIEFDQNLEADLGVDSIKRVDIVGGVLDKLPDSYKNGLGEEGRTSLNTATTLQNMLDILEKAGDSSVNFKLAEVSESIADSGNASSYSPRLEKSRAKIEAVREDIPESAIKGLTEGTFIITEDSLQVSNEIASLIEQKNCNAVMVPNIALKDEGELWNWCVENDAAIDSVAGIIHLSAIGSKALNLESAKEDWQEQIFINEKALFLLVKLFSKKIKKDAHILSATSLGGLFGRQRSSEKGLSLQGGGVGMIKSLCKERESIRGKVVDIDSNQSKAAIAVNILAELELVGGRQEVGYPKGVRTIFKTVYTGMDNLAESIDEKGLVVLATGGARGVTAEVLREVAKSGNKLVLTGRSHLPTADKILRDDAQTAVLTDEKSLARYFVKNQSMGLGEARKKASSVLAAREIVDNIEDFKNSGAEVEYYSVDVTDEKAMQEMFESLYKKYGKIDGIVHGAGIIEDKFLADIESDSWSRVVNTKVIGMLLLQKYVDESKLKFFTVFSSVAGRYGNTGQSNYATANELMNRICSQLQKVWNNDVKVSALCWGPWGKTKFGAGMVTAATEAKFSKHGVHLVTADLGRKLFRYQVVNSKVSDDPEIVCGEAPWEESEERKGKIKQISQAASDLLGDEKIEEIDSGEFLLSLTLNKNQPYLQDHVINENAVLPMAVAIEIMAEAAAKAFGEGWQVSEISDAQLFKGVFVDSEQYPLAVKMVMTSHGMDGHSVVKAKIVAAGEKPLPHYGATIILSPVIEEATEEAPEIIWHDSREFSTGEAYNDWLFHGDTFQVIDSIDEFSEQGAKCIISSTSQKNLLGIESKKNWLFDPAVIDAAAQMSVLWMAACRNLFALPVKFERIVRFSDSLPEKLTMKYVITDENPESITVDTYFEDENGNLLIKIESMKHMVAKGQKVGIKKDKLVA
jgi:acyl transferase domain-containing protein/NAD(P)H-dependent flavin oxidoreductase YrpB (nitropropane dioxygenase family)/NADP-dependent 3-hydroxy acid dehydrogenase YdfG/acyl carrier protein